MAENLDQKEECVGKGRTSQQEEWENRKVAAGGGKKAGGGGKLGNSGQGAELFASKYQNYSSIKIL